MTGPGAEPSGFSARLEAAMDAPAFGDALSAARWSGLGGRSAGPLRLLDAFAFPDDGGSIAIVEATPAGADRPEWYAIPSDDPLLGPGAGRMASPRPTSAPGRPPATGLPGPWTGLLGLAIDGEAITGSGGGRLVGRPGRTAALLAPAGSARSRGARPAPGDQSHTSVIVDETAILKLYRRLSPGINPEAEVLAVLPPEAPVPPWIGAVDLVLGDGSTTTIAAAQGFVADADDAFETLAEALAAWLATSEPQGDGPATWIAAVTGDAVGRLHRALAGVGAPGFEPRAATSADRAAWLATAEARLDAAVAAVGSVDVPMAARLRAAGPTIRRALRPLGDPAIPVRLTRIHGDLHLGQVLLSAGRALLVDFEGDPLVEPARRAELAPPLRDVAGFLRSLDHVARSGLRRAARRSGGPAGPAAEAAAAAWIEQARAAFLAAYALGTGAPDWSPDRALLRAMEVDKEVGEFAYAAAFLPDWRYAPAGGLRALVGAVVDVD